MPNSKAVRFQALSIVAPSGDRIRAGLKTIEVRRWHPEEVPLKNLLIVQNGLFLSEDLPEDPEGRAVAVVDVVGVREWTPEDLGRSCATVFEPGWLAWEIGNVRPVSYPAFLPARRRIYSLELDPTQMTGLSP